MTKKVELSGYFESGYDYEASAHELFLNRPQVLQMNISDDLLAVLPKSFKSVMSIDLTPKKGNPTNEAGMKKIHRVLKDAEQVDLLTGLQ